MDGGDGKRTAERRWMISGWVDKKEEQGGEREGGKREKGSGVGKKEGNRSNSESLPLSLCLLVPGQEPLPGPGKGVKGQTRLLLQLV